MSHNQTTLRLVSLWLKNLWASEGEVSVSGCSNTHISHSLTDFRAKESRLLAVYTNKRVQSTPFIAGHCKDLELVSSVSKSP